MCWRWLRGNWGGLLVLEGEVRKREAAGIIILG